MKFLCLFLLLSTAAMARPDYFPTPAKGEWNYQLTAGGQMAQRTRRVVSQVTRLPGGGEEIVVRDTTPTEILTTYRKVGGWVYCDRTVTPSVQSTFDYDKDLTELKNPPAAGDKWSYQGTGGGLVLKQEWSCLGPDTVKVPAGRFRTMKVVTSYTLAGNLCKITHWYADQVGLVKSVSESSAVVTTIELVSYKLPKH